MSLNKRGAKAKAQEEVIDTNYLFNHPCINNNNILQEFRRRKKSKFPTIQHSRNILMQHLQTEKPNRIHQLTKDIDNRRQFLTQINKTEAQTPQLSHLQKYYSPLLIPRLGKLVIDRQNPLKPRREYLGSHSASQLHRYQQVNKYKQVNLQNYQLQLASNRKKTWTQNIQRRNQNSLIKMTRKIKLRYRASDYDAIKSFTTNVSIVSNQKKIVSLSRLCSLGRCALSISRLDPISPAKAEKLKFANVQMRVNYDKVKSYDKIKNIGRIKLSFEELMKKRQYLRKIQKLEPWSQQDIISHLPYSRVYGN